MLVITRRVVVVATTLLATLLCAVWLVHPSGLALVSKRKHRRHKSSSDDKHGDADRFARLSVLGMQIPSEAFAEWIMRAPEVLPSEGSTKLSYKPNILVYLGAPFCRAFELHGIRPR